MGWSWFSLTCPPWRVTAHHLPLTVSNREDSIRNAPNSFYCNTSSDSNREKRGFYSELLFPIPTDVVDQLPALQIRKLLLKRRHGPIPFRGDPVKIAIRPPRQPSIAKIRGLAPESGGLIALPVAVLAVARRAVRVVIFFRFGEDLRSSWNRIRHVVRGAARSAIAPERNKSAERGNDKDSQRDKGQAFTACVF